MAAKVHYTVAKVALNRLLTFISHLSGGWPIFGCGRLTKPTRVFQIIRVVGFEFKPPTHQPRGENIITLDSKGMTQLQRGDNTNPVGEC